MCSKLPPLASMHFCNRLRKFSTVVAHFSTLILSQARVRAVSLHLEQRHLAAILAGSQPDGLHCLVHPGAKSLGYTIRHRRNPKNSSDPRLGQN